MGCQCAKKPPVVIPLTKHGDLLGSSVVMLTSRGTRVSLYTRDGNIYSTCMALEELLEKLGQDEFAEVTLRNRDAAHVRKDAIVMVCIDGDETCFKFEGQDPKKVKQTRGELKRLLDWQ